MGIEKSEVDTQRIRPVGYLICAFGFALTLWAFYPGLMSPDSIASLNEGRSGVIYDQNSPLMSYLWGGLDRIVAGPALMLVLQLAVFWSGVAILWEASYRESRVLGLSLVLFPFLPQILSQLPVIWKDVGMAVTLLSAVALIYYAQKRRSRTALFLSAIFLLYATVARLNAVPAVVPVAIWAGFVAASIFEFGRRPLTSLAVGIAYCLILLSAAYAVQTAITGGRSSSPVQFILLYDLAAIAIAKGEPVFPSYVVEGENFSMEKVVANYSTTTVGGLIYSEEPAGRQPPLALTEDPHKISQLRSVWWQQVLGDPATYLRHRAAVFGKLIGLGPSVSFQYWDLDLTRNPPEYPIEKSAAGGFLTGYFRIFQRPVMQTFFFRAIVWMLALGYFLYRSLRGRLRGDWALVGVLAASSLLYIFSYFFTAPAADFRYVYWPAIASAVTVIFGVYLLRKEKAELGAQT